METFFLLCLLLTGVSFLSALGAQPITSPPDPATEPSGPPVEGALDDEDTDQWVIRTEAAVQRAE